MNGLGTADLYLNRIVLRVFFSKLMFRTALRTALCTLLTLPQGLCDVDASTSST